MNKSVEAPAFQIRILDSAMQAHLQRWPFSTGPDAEKNQAGLNAIRQCLHMREPGMQTAVQFLAPDRTRLSAEETVRLENIFQQLQYTARHRRTLLDDFEWEANMLPRTCRNVLCIGCGNAMELLFLSAVLPDCTLTAIDYGDSVEPRVKQLLGLTLHVGDMNKLLPNLPGGYDLIVSNHTLEHLYTPDETLRSLYDLLMPGGHLISTLPMDAMPGSPFLEKVRRTALTNSLHAMDAVYLDSGHPWKTNPADLHRTLLATGFREVTLYQRAQHLSRTVAGSRFHYELGKNIGRLLNFVSGDYRLDKE